MAITSNGKGSAAGSAPRCIALVGPFGSGKTSLLEALLARTDKVARQGSVANGNTVGDASPEARAHGMSVELNIADAEFLGDRFVFVDCPGSVEFLSEMDGALSGVDLAVVVAEDDERKVPALQLILKALEARAIPRVLFLNKIDKSTRRVRDVLSVLQPASAVPLVLRQIPIWEDGLATGFIDLALERAHVYHEKEESTQIDMSDADLAREHEARFTMLEHLADHDDDLMEALLEDIAPNRDQVFADLVNEMQDGLICPVFFGSAEHGNGVSRLLKALRHEVPGVDLLSRRVLGTTSRAMLQVVKTLHTQHGGKQSIARVLEGVVSDGDTLFLNGDTEIKVSGLFSVFGQQANKIATAGKGDLVGLGRLDDVQTGDLLSFENGKIESLQVLERRNPVLATAISAKQRKDEVRLSAALAKLVEEDRSLIVSQNQTTAETLLAGQGEMHLRVAQERLAGKYGLDIAANTPHVPYAETIRSGTKVRGRHKKQSGGHGQFGDVVIEISPLPRGEGVQFSDTITGGVVPKQYIPSVRDGVLDALGQGPLGFPVVDVSVCLTDGSYHSVDSSDQAFKMAGILAIREGLPECKPVLLEPIHKVVIACPSDATARVNAIVSARRGQLLGFDARPEWNGWDEVQALMPEAEIGDLIIELRSATAGVASYTAEFDHMAELSGKAADIALQRSGRQAA
ncbi:MULTISPECIES: elongation factor G [Alphaproteobacteria]|uniref:elongation factor G n=1 Tax=Alphaproteobacteria TaxID=28211 RepID=UPI00126867BB|nr:MULTISPECIES: elongation factor G [Stappiaceae]MEC9418816.1 elongation factor G [Pseudomonadota bacterium]MBN8181729.1 elongation factor G [Roseibium aggregatum]QFT67819.1 Elongation factor G [Labrenzia sp. THAF35]UES43598.1 elongation factor G [Roseibium aggregatum]WJS04380.1 elongation factor G [Roseibium aggregatum]